MYIKKIHMENYGSFQDTTIMLPEKGLIYLHGNNQDDSYSTTNGIGKTCMLDSVPFALYSRTLREGNKKRLTQKEVIRLGTSSGSCSLEIEDEDGNYEVTREVTKTGGNLFIKYHGETLKGQFAQDFLTKKLNFSYQAFVSSCLFGQGMFNTFMSGTEEDKMKLLEELFRLNELDTIRSSMKDTEDELGTTLATKSRELSLLEKEFSVLDTRYNMLKELETHNRTKAQETLDNSRLPQMEEYYTKLDSEIKKQEGRLEEAKIRLDIIERYMHDYRKEDIVNLEEGKPCPLCDSILREVPERHKAKKETLVNKAKIYEAHKLELSDRKLEIKVLQEELQKLYNKRIEVVKDKEVEEKNIDAAKKVLQFADTRLSDTEDKRRHKEEEVGILKQEVEKVIEKRNNMVTLRKLLGSSELRGKIVNNYLGLVNHYAKKYVSFLTNSEVDLEFTFRDNKIEAMISNKHGNRLPFLRYSGGERKRIDIALFLAFNMMNKYLYSAPLRILLLDEAFDALDSSGVEKVVELLRKEENELGLVIVTGHHEALEDMFKKKITLVKRNGISCLA